MEVCLNAKAYCTDGPCGRLTHIILKASNQTATHLVIKTKDAPSIDVPVPLQWMELTDGRLIQLHCTRRELGRLPPFIEIRWPRPDEQSAASWIDVPLMQKLLMRPLYCFERRMRLGTDEIPLHRHIRIVTDEGRTGRLTGLVIDPEDHRVVCFALRSGARWNAKKVWVRSSQVAHIGRYAIGPQPPPDLGENRTAAYE